MTHNNARKFIKAHQELDIILKTVIVDKILLMMRAD